MEQLLAVRTVTESEVGDDGAAYSVEVRLSDGCQVEVQLNANFEVTGSTADDDGSPATSRRAEGPRKVTGRARTPGC